jgi:hypothetical protein
VRTYESWLLEVRTGLASINMPMDEWQGTWRFDFFDEYQKGTDPIHTLKRQIVFGGSIRIRRSTKIANDRLPAGCLKDTKAIVNRCEPL